jgi:hypothetical protein
MMPDRSGLPRISQAATRINFMIRMEVRLGLRHVCGCHA